AYSVASVSGAVLAVCSCTVLPLFAGIYRMGAGLGPATSFLYSGPAINILAIVLTANVLGIRLGIARVVGAIFFSIVIGIMMHIIFRNEEKEKAAAQAAIPDEKPKRPLWKNALYFTSMVGILVFTNWGKPVGNTGLWVLIYSAKWFLTSFFALSLGIILVVWFNLKWWKVALIALSVSVLIFLFPGHHLVPFAAAVIGISIITSTGNNETEEWFSSSWKFAKQILPLLMLGVLVAGALLGRVGYEGLIPSGWIEKAVGGNSLRANFFSSFAGAFMYFATLTEVPILQGLIGSGMGKGPALALLLAGPALSLPNMLVIRSVIGNKKTLVFVTLVIVMATFSGMIYGTFFN
ncbi:permease, partial [bacterium]|nr:permease [bacterium]